MTVIALTHAHHNPFVPITPPHKNVFTGFRCGARARRLALFRIRQLSTVAQEVDNPRRNYPLALAIVVPMSIATYFLPTFRFARRAEQLAGLGFRLFFGGSALARWRDFGRVRDHCRGCGKCLSAEQYRPRNHAYAFCDGRRRFFCRSN